MCSSQAPRAVCSFFLYSFHTQKACPFSQISDVRDPLALFFSLSLTGIGAACATALAEAGANICLVRRPNSTNDETYNAISATGRTVKTVECDLADLDAVKGLFAKALEAMGGEIHVLVNCAGIQRRSPAVQFAESDWDDVRVRLRLPVFPACAFSVISCFSFRALSCF